MNQEPNKKLKSEQVRKIAFAGCKDTTYECISSLLEQNIRVDLLITIDPETALKNNVAGYMDLRSFAEENNIPLYVCDKYSLNSDKDREFLSSLKIDLLFVIGWQRLIPLWLLEKLNIGAFGMHGASKPLPYGRGRSPMNWSIIQNKKLFITNLFKYRPGVDDGDILDTQIFDLNDYDTAETAHYKNTLSMIKLIENNIQNLLNCNYKLKPQMSQEPTYYPKRTEEDGCIFWKENSSDIYNLVRAVTKPFPGAFTFYEDKKIRIWRCYPFDSRLFDPYIKPGTILHVFVNGDFIVKTGDGSIIVKEYETPEGNFILKKGIALNSAGLSFKNPNLYPLEKV
jgi:methionyl-tRNA formyltransferase